MEETLDQLKADNESLVKELVRVKEILGAARELAARQAEDEGLWFIAITISEHGLQKALRELTAIIELEIGPA